MELDSQQKLLAIVSDDINIQLLNIDQYMTLYENKSN